MSSLAAQAGARALGLDRVGAIAPGQCAGFDPVQHRSTSLDPRHDLAANIVYAAYPSDITHVMRDGRWRLRDGALTTLDEEPIKRQAEQRAYHG